MYLNPVFSSHMVLQRNKDIKVFGLSDGEVTVGFGGEDYKALPDESGKWSVTIPKLSDGGPFDMEIKGDGEKIILRDIMIGEVFLAGGQSNMTHPTFATIGGFGKAENLYNENIRFFTVPHKEKDDDTGLSWHFDSVSSHLGAWKICAEDSALHFSAIGFYFASLLQEYLKVPVGIISCNWGGTEIEAWIDENLLRKDPRFSYKFDCEKTVSPDHEKEYIRFRNDLTRECLAVDAIEVVRQKGITSFAEKEGIAYPDYFPFGPLDPNFPGNLFRNMLMTVAGYPIKGVLWYQGESNVTRYREYAILYDIMVKNWHDIWNDDFKFYTVQVAPFAGEGASEWAKEWSVFMNEQRIISLSRDDTYMITAVEEGEKHNIHPLNKQSISRKLFTSVLVGEYGGKAEYSGPIAVSANREGDEIRIDFSHAEGSLCYFREKVPLETEDSEGNISPAYAKTDGSSLVLKLQNAEKIKAVCFSYYLFPKNYLFNRQGYAASPFRLEI